MPASQRQPFVAYLSSLTNLRFSATQYGLLTLNYVAVARLIGGYSGVLVDKFGYEQFFFLSACWASDAWLLIVWQWRNDRRKAGQTPMETEG